VFISAGDHFVSDFPDTRASLLLQVQNPANRDAWDVFASIYRPVIVRIAAAKGMQHADAQDLSQQVLLSVAGAIGDWEQRDETTRFRHWLSRVTRNAILNALTRGPRDRAVGGSAAEHLLEDLPSVDESVSALIETEYRRELYLRAAKTVQAEFRTETWRAFEMSVSEGQPIEDVAAALGKSAGAIYTARSRVMFRLSEVIAELEKAH